MTITQSSPVPINLDLASPLRFAARYSEGRWRPAAHFGVLDYEFRRHLRSNDADILVVMAPPRHGKSEALSRWWMAWYHSVYPENRSILTSYSASLANAHSRWVRNTVHRLAPVFGGRGVNPSVRALNEWQMEGTQGGMRSAGVAGSIVGHGADLIVIDDYLKNAEDASRQKIRDSQWEWLTTTALTRLQPNGKVVILATPWHQDDLIGRIRSKKDEIGFRVRVLKMPAIYEDDSRPDPCGRQLGEALWPSQWSLASLQKRRSAMEPYWWNAIYQCAATDSGMQEWPQSYFVGAICRDDEWPASFGLSAQSLDPSHGRHAKRGDYSAIAFVGYSNGSLWVDVDMDRRPVPRMMADYVRVEQRYRPRLVGIEGNAWQELLAEPYWQACNAVGWEPSDPVFIENTVAKITRIRRLGVWLSKGKLRIRNTTGGRLLLQQLKEFPNGQHDDGPDAVEQAIRLLGLAAELGSEDE